MFFGAYEHTLDEKNRIVIPRKMREALGNKIVILKGFDGALSLYKEDDFTKYAEEVNNLPYNKKSSRDYIRIQLSSASECEIDKQGRTIIPPYLMKKYSIGKEIIIIGVGNHIELWDKATYLAYEEKSNKEFEANAEEIELKHV